MAAALLLQRPLHCALYYDTLAAIDLGADAANLYDGRPPTDWADDLKQAYDDAPGRLTAQIVPLLIDDLDDTLTLLAADVLAPLSDAPGRALQAMLLEILTARRDAFTRDWLAREESARAEAQAWWTRWAATLRELDRGLHQGSELPRSELRILACPALRSGSFSHGRALTLETCRWVAVALEGVDPEQALLQIVHELCHRFSDPDVLSSSSTHDHDTRAGAPLHRALEVQAIAHGQALLDRLRPDLGPAYRRWRERYGM